MVTYGDRIQIMVTNGDRIRQLDDTSIAQLLRDIVQTMHDMSIEELKSLNVNEYYTETLEWLGQPFVAPVTRDDIPSQDIQELSSDNNNIETSVPVDEEVKELQNDSEPVVLDGVDQG